MMALPPSPEVPAGSHQQGNVMEWLHATQDELKAKERLVYD